jgi:glycine/D-amino acid oxidase-like deaminating enzyme
VSAGAATSRNRAREARAGILADAAPRPFWLDQPDAPAPRAPLEGPLEADLVVVGGGLTGLWTALQAAEEGRRVVLLEAERIAFAASGRNGGFCAASLTHGVLNGLSRWPREIDALERMGRENLVGMRADVERHGIDCGWEDTGAIDVATAPHQVAWLAGEAEQLRRLGWDAELLDAGAMRAQVDSPTYLGGLWSRDACALVDPARLCWGLARAVEAAGGRVFERSAVTALRRDGAGVRAATAAGAVRARHALLATSAFPPLVRAIRRYVAPVYDYVLVTEPLSQAQRGAIGWRGRQGLSDVANRFHYYRQTADDRILWGGYDAIYRFGGRVTPERDQRPATFELLAEHFFATFPQLEGLRFSHRWGGAIDTSSRFSALWGRALGSRAIYVVGLHRARRRREPLRRAGRPRPARRARDRAHAAGDGAAPAAPVPARAGALGRHPADAPGARARGRAGRPPRPVAARARPAWPRLRLLSG